QVHDVGNGAHRAEVGALGGDAEHQAGEQPQGTDDGRGREFRHYRFTSYPKLLIYGGMTKLVQAIMVAGPRSFAMTTTVLDTKGLNCPLPVLRAKKAI